VNDVRAVRVTIVIERLSDGVLRKQVDVWNYGWPVADTVKAARFWWLEGNGACDCNRELTFARAGGEPVPPELPCSHDRYRISWLEFEPILYALPQASENSPPNASASPIDEGTSTSSSDR
jgi:hypothetical protein